MVGVSAGENDAVRVVRGGVEEGFRAEKADFAREMGGLGVVGGGSAGRRR